MYDYPASLQVFSLTEKKCKCLAFDKSITAVRIFLRPLLSHRFACGSIEWPAFVCLLESSSAILFLFPLYLEIL